MATSTPNGWDSSSSPVNFDGGRVRAWLGVENPARPEGRSSCSRAVQTDGVGELNLEFVIDLCKMFWVIFFIYLFFLLAILWMRISGLLLTAEVLCQYYEIQV